MGNDLGRFLDIPESTYKKAIYEINNGKKKTHWMWYVFPQIGGLGNSELARKYAIKNREEAEEYVADPELRDRLWFMTRLVLNWPGNDISEMFEYPDNLKLRSCMTLFYMVTEDELFKKVLDKYFQGKECSYTREHLDDTTVIVEYFSESERIETYYECKNCGCDDILETFFFCPNCGKKITAFKKYDENNK